MSKVEICSVVDRQFPEHIREDYPAFVAFVHAYYEWVKTQQIDLINIKDLDKTLEDFVVYFKNELSYNLPSIISDERFILERIRDQYLAKGSEASYKLLFRLLFGKDIQIFYPGQQMLIASDGRWNQERSIFAQVEFGDPDFIVGKVVDIEEEGRILRVQINKKQNLTGEIDRVVALGGNIYEFFLDKKIYGQINVGNIIKYEDQFKAFVLPTTSELNVYDAGEGFRIGQVFEIKSSTGTGTLVKVIRVNDVGGIVHAQIIRFGIGYIADFTASILPSDSITTRSTVFENEALSTVKTNLNGAGDIIVGVEPEVNVNELGFISTTDYVDYQYVDGTYAGTIIKEFSFDARLVSSSTVKPAIIEIKLSSLARYPGYYETNNGFLSDSIFIQDSKYYQIYSYVIKIDERLSAYKTAVKTMLHPAGVALFGEFEITNSFDLSVELESLVKSLALGIEDIPVVITDTDNWVLFKPLSSDPVVINEPTVNNFVGGGTSILTSVILKSFSPAYSNSETIIVSDTEPVAKDYTTLKQNSVEMQDNNFVAAVGVSLATSQSVNDNNIGKSYSTGLTSPNTIVSDFLFLQKDDTKYIFPTIEYINQSEFGYVVKDPYEEGGYFNEIYVNNRDAIFSS